MKQTRLSRVAAVIPCYNAGDRVAGVLAGVAKFVESAVVVDDGSTDGCLDSVPESGMRVIRFPVNRGKGFALKEGLAAAIESPEIRAVVCLDADAQHDPAEIPQLVAAFEELEADLVIGSREFGGDGVPWRSRFGNRLTVWVVGRLLGARLPDTQSGYRVLSRRFIEAFLATSRGGRYEFEMEMLAFALRGDFRVEPVSIQTIYESGNPSSHFQKVRDSWLIYRTLLGAAFRGRGR